MSESNEAFEYFGSRSSNKSRVGKDSFDVLDKVNFVSNALDLNVCTDSRCSESGVNNSSHLSPEQKQEDDYRSQMVNLPKLLNQLFNARVVLDRLSISTRAADLRKTHTLTSDNPASNKLVTTSNRQSPADLVRRYCSKCELTVANVSVSTAQLCAECGTLLKFQCIRCDKLYKEYKGLNKHLNVKCNSQNLDLKCPKCDYRTHVREYMNRHKRRCLSELIHSCSHCKYMTEKRSNLRVHMREKHKDNDMKARGDLVAIRDTSDIADDQEKENRLTTTEKRLNPANLIKRYCSKCKTTDADAGVTTTQQCAKCRSLLAFQCNRCDKLFSEYNNLRHHLIAICNRQNLDFKCPKCDYRSHVKDSMTAHLNYCTSGIIYRCSHCNHTVKQRSNLYKHMRRMHKDICHAACSKCRGKPIKCHQCKNIRLICRNCHVGFGSNDRLLEHYESCKK